MANNINIKSEEVLSHNFFSLKKITLEMVNSRGDKEELVREVYQSTNGATALLFNRKRGTVILTNQFRLPSYLNDNPTGKLIETCAGIVEKGEDPDVAMLREIEEETGYKVEKVIKLFDLFMTPGSVTERLYFYVAEYEQADKEGEGGGLAEEHEDIKVIEMPFEEAFIKIKNGEIRDAKTVILLQYARIYLFQEEKVFDVL